MRILVLFLLSLLPILAKAQHNHFIYIQGDNQQNFYIKKGGELLSSSSSGFIILPKLEPGTHQFIVGFPKDQWPEYAFNLDVKDKDRGFTLKNFQDKGWGLFDMQSMDIIMGRRIEVKKEEKPLALAMTDDPFSVILASVVDDPRIRETSLISSASMVSVSPTGKPDDKNALAKIDNKTIVPNKTATPVTKADEQKVVKTTPPETRAVDEQKTVKAAPPETKPVEDQKVITAAPPESKPVEDQKVVKTAPPESKPVDDQKVAKAAPPETKTVADPKPIAGQSEVVSPPVDSKEKYSAQKVRKISELKTWSGYNITYIDFSGPTPDTIYISIDDSVTSGASDAEAKPSATGETKVKMPRTDCRNMAREKDVLAIRKKMLMLTDDADMVNTVIREVKAKCFTTDQLQNLSYVFVNDKGRFQLFEEAYPYVFDPANYERLERLFNSDDYISRFRSLIKSN